MTLAIALFTIIHVFGFGPDCTVSEGRALNRELLMLKERVDQAVRRHGPLSDDAIELRDEAREKQDEIRERNEACDGIAMRRDRPLK